MVLWMKRPQSNRAKDLLALERDKLRIGIGLLTSYVFLKRYKLGFAEQTKCRLFEKEGEDNLYILYYCLALSCKRYRFWGRMFLEPEDLAVEGKQSYKPSIEH